MQIAAPSQLPIGDDVLQQYGHLVTQAAIGL